MRGAPVTQLSAVRCGRAGVSRGEPGQDGALPLPVLDTAALYFLCAGGPAPAQPGGEVWGGSAARQVRSQRHAATGVGVLIASEEVTTYSGVTGAGFDIRIVQGNSSVFFL